MRCCFLVGLGILCGLAGCGGESAQITVVAQEPESFAGFGTVRADQPSSMTVTVTKPFVPGGTVQLVEASGAFAPAPGELPGTAGNGIEYPLKIVFDPAAAIAQNEGTTGFMRLRFTKADGSYTSTSLLTLTATVESPLSPSVQATLDFGGTALGQLAKDTIAITNVNKATPVTISSGVAGGVPFGVPQVFPVIIPPGGTARIAATYAPTTTGPHATNVTLAGSIGGPFTTTLLGQGIESEVVTDFGLVPVDGAGETAWLELPVSAEAISIHLEIFGEDPGADIYLIGFEGPGGVVYENDSFTGPYNWFNNYPVGYGALFLQLPNGDEPGIKLVRGGGTYRFRLADFATNAGLRIRARVERRFKGRVSEGLLALNVFLAPGLPVSAATASTHDGMQTILATMDALLGQRGLRLGSVGFFDVANPAYTDIDSYGELDQLTTESASAPEERLNLFFVDSFTFDPDLLGISNGLPGPKKNGTIYSGVVIAYSGGSPAFLGSTAAHEGGHFLGLFHTADFDDLWFIEAADPIVDTPICDIDEISLYCQTIGDSNLMWPYELGYVDGLRVTGGQGNIMKNHPLVEPGMPAAQAQLAQLSQLAQNHLPVEVHRGWCANCAAARRR